MRNFVSNGDRVCDGCSLVLAAVLSVCAFPVVAQVTIPEEYGKTIKSAQAVGALGPDLFGEQVNFYTGATSFNATDVSLPGNDALPVAIGRTLAVGSRDPLVSPGDGMWTDWDLDIPHIEGVFPLNDGWAVQNFVPGQGWGDRNHRCSAGGLGQPVTATGTFNGLWSASEYWQGYQMRIPGSGSQELLRANGATNPNQPTDGKAYKWMTAGNWFISCLTATANGYPGEGFLAVSPNGVKYRFDWFVSRPASVIVKQRGDASTRTRDATPFGPADDKTSLSRVEVWALPTRIEDRFGNWVTYTYDANKPWRLKEINAKDQRKLTIAYNARGRISQVTAGTRTWTYVEGANGLEVALPDQSKWIYATSGIRRATATPETNAQVTRFCERAGGKDVRPVHTATINHPSGAVGTFKFQSRAHGRSYVQKVCVKPNQAASNDHAKYPYLFDAVGLVEKSIAGPGLPSNMKWIYTYGAPNQSWAENCPNQSCGWSKTVEVAGPGEWTRFTFSNRWEHSEGKLMKVERGAGPTSILKTEITTYLFDPTGQRYAQVVGVNPFDRGDRTTEVLQPVIKRETIQQARRFTWQVGATNGVYDLDRFGRPTKVVKTSAPAP